jgi:hypothetical protein
MRRFSALIALVWLWAVPALAKPNLLPLMGVGGKTGTVTYTGPGDIVSFTAWYGLRAYSQAIVTAGTQALVNLQRTSDSHTCDIIVSASGGLGNTANCSTGGDNGTAAATWCNATTCNVLIAYDQTGGGRPMNNYDTAQPLIFNCFGSLPCIQLSSGHYLQTTGNYTPATGVVSISAVGERSTGTNGFMIVLTEDGGTSGNQLVTKASSNAWVMGPAGLGITGTASDAAVHAANGVINGGSSALNIDGTETTGTVNGVTSAGQIAIAGAAANVLEEGEWGFLDNSAVSSGTRTSLCHNQYLYWTTATSC